MGRHRVVELLDSQGNVEREFKNCQEAGEFLGRSGCAVNAAIRNLTRVAGRMVRYAKDGAQATAPTASPSAKKNPPAARVKPSASLVAAGGGKYAWLEKEIAKREEELAKLREALVILERPVA